MHDLANSAAMYSAFPERARSSPADVTEGCRITEPALEFLWAHRYLVCEVLRVNTGGAAGGGHPVGASGAGWQGSTAEDSDECIEERRLLLDAFLIMERLGYPAPACPSAWLLASDRTDCLPAIESGMLASLSKICRLCSLTVAHPTAEPSHVCLLRQRQPLAPKRLPLVRGCSPVLQRVAARRRRRGAYGLRSLMP